MVSHLRQVYVSEKFEHPENDQDPFEESVHIRTELVILLKMLESALKIDRSREKCLEFLKSDTAMRLPSLKHTETKKIYSKATLKILFRLRKEFPH